MKKKFTGIFSIIVAVSALFLFFHASFFATAQELSEDALVSVYQAPTSTTIVLGTSQGSVTVNNFYATALGADGEFIRLAQNNYKIDYDTDNSSFDLDVDPASFDTGRASAEANFLTLLGISQTDACKLTVAVSEVAASSSLRLPLSFCASSTFGQ
jgi:hypothetical protein